MGLHQYLSARRHLLHQNAVAACMRICMPVIGIPDMAFALHFQALFNKKSKHQKIKGA